MVNFEWYIHVYMEMSQGNSLYSYLKQAKIPFVSLQKWRGGHNRSCLGVCYQWERGGYGDRV
jgi:hypothetical protein